jgi:serralysin
VKGIDKIQFSGLVDCTIDLRAGNFSSLSAPIYFSDGSFSTSTVTIGPQTIIENATGGSGNDVIVGNSSGNKLSGGSGNDALKGSTGDDQLTGGAGDDVLWGAQDEIGSTSHRRESQSTV